MLYFIPQPIVDRLSGEELRLYATLCSLAARDRQHEVSKGQRWLAAHLRRTDRAIRKWERRLRDLNLVQVRYVKIRGYLRRRILTVMQEVRLLPARRNEALAGIRDWFRKAFLTNLNRPHHVGTVGPLHSGMKSLSYTRGLAGFLGERFKTLREAEEWSRAQDLADGIGSEEALKHPKTCTCEECWKAHVEKPDPE